MMVVDVSCVVTVPGEDPEFVRAKYFFRDEFLVGLMVYLFTLLLLLPLLLLLLLLLLLSVFVFLIL